MYYIHKDYLGSYQTITNESGGTAEILSFDPWGRRRNSDSWTSAWVPTSFLFDRGYTGHEHLEEFDLININGRVYDPLSAQFLSPDIFVQNPELSQDCNRYNYTRNNPFKYVDPTGYKLVWKDLWAFIDPFYTFARMTGNSPDKAFEFTPTYLFGVALPRIMFEVTGNNTMAQVWGGTTSQPVSPVYLTNGQRHNSLEEMVKFMTDYSEQQGIEISGYVYVTDAGLTVYYSNPTVGNTNKKSNNPYRHAGDYNVTKVDPPGEESGTLVAQIHVHPSYLYSDRMNQYDGPSFDDQTFARVNHVPVYSIGPNSVSRIDESSPYRSWAQFDQGLSKGEYNPYRFAGPEWINSPRLVDSFITF